MRHGGGGGHESTREDIFYAESVLQDSPGLPYEVGLPWDGTMKRQNPEGVRQGGNHLRNPFRVVGFLAS